VAPIVMSAIVFAGAAQFAALSVLSDGGSAAAAIIAGVLLNARFLPMGVAIAPSLRVRPAVRAATGQTLVDASWALANRGEGRFDIDFLVGATIAQYPAWVAGTAIGVIASGGIGDPGRFGLDAIFPAFFLGLLVNELRSPHTSGVALGGAALALVLTPIAPPGVPVLAACLAALAGAMLR
jgi:predicted branched-subunit amino acid permease